MNNLRNKVQLIGNIGQTPELKNLESGKSVLNFSLATNESYKDEKGEKITNTSWHNIVAWGKTAELLSKLTKKGSSIAVEGKITYRSWENKEGQKIRETEIVIEDFLLLDKKVE
tara:strand:- start:1934 stop:2275 length:342 start_codon:yes stop_codon:yes gene_type:complete